MKKTNKILAFFLILAMVSVLAACGGNNGSNGNNGGSTNTSGSSDGGAQANDNPYNLDYTSGDLQSMSDERASKEALLEAEEYYMDGLSSVADDIVKQTYKDVAEHIGVDASEYQYFENYGQHRYTWYVEGNEGPSLLVVFDKDGKLFSVTSSIS